MNDQRIAIITDSGTDTPADFAAAHDVRVVPLVINYSDGSYRSGIDITAVDVVRRFEQEIPSTSLPSPDDIRRAIEQARDDGYERAVFVTISSGLSATNQTAHLVANQVEGFPVTVVDTKSIGLAAGMVVMRAVEMAEGGVPFEEIGGKLEALSADTRVFFAVRDLLYLRRGGRISEPVYRLGSLLNLKPVMFCDPDGKYAVVKKCRGWEKAIAAELALVREHAARFDRVRVGCCAIERSALAELEDMLRDAIPNATGLVSCTLSPDLVVHTGPSLVGMACQPA